MFICVVACSICKSTLELLFLLINPVVFVKFEIHCLPKLIRISILFSRGFLFLFSIIVIKSYYFPFLLDHGILFTYCLGCWVGSDSHVLLVRWCFVSVQLERLKWRWSVLHTSSCAHDLYMRGPGVSNTQRVLVWLGFNTGLTYLTLGSLCESPFTRLQCIVSPQYSQFSGYYSRWVVAVEGIPWEGGLAVTTL